MSANEEKIVLEEELLDDEEDTQKDKYLTFQLAGEVYGIEIYFVTEIIGIQKITEVPDTPGFMKGIINLRGKVIPLIDVRSRFNLEEIEYGDRTCIIVVNVNDMPIGLIVDEVSEVLDITGVNIDPPPRTGKGTKSKYIKGIGKVGDNVKIILDIEKLLNDNELDDLMNL